MWWLVWKVEQQDKGEIGKESGPNLGETDVLGFDWLGDHSGGSFAGMCPCLYPRKTTWSPVISGHGRIMQASGVATATDTLWAPPKFPEAHAHVRYQ